jgi:hypothetical protein
MTCLKLLFRKGNRHALLVYKGFPNRYLTEKRLESKKILERVKDQLALQEPRL